MYLPKERIHQPAFTNKGHIELGSVEHIDNVVVERLFFHIKQITDLPEYTRSLEAKRQEKARALAQVLDSLKSIPLEQERLVAQIRKTESEGVRDLSSKQVENLEIEKERLQKVLSSLQKEHDALLSALTQNSCFLNTTSKTMTLTDGLRC